MVNPDEFPGIQSLCMKIAYRMCKFYPELMGEFMRTIESMDMTFYKPAVKCVRSRILGSKRQTTNSVVINPKRANYDDFVAAFKKIGYEIKKK